MGNGYYRRPQASYQMINGIKAMPGTKVSYEGTFRRVTYYNQDNGFIVGIVKTPDGDDVTTTGTIQGFREGQAYRFTGSVVNDPRYGAQVKIATVEPTFARGKENILIALRSLKGIGPRKAQMIYDKLGDDALEKIKEDPSCLNGVPGCSGKKGEEISAELRNNARMIEVETFFHSVGIQDPRTIMRLIRNLGVKEDEDPMKAVELVRANPYVLTKVRGYAFKRADRLALADGIDELNPHRVRCAVLQTMRAIAQRPGDTVVALPKLIKQCASPMMLVRDGDESDGCEKYGDAIRRAVVDMLQTPENPTGALRASAEGNDIHLAYLYKAENQIAYCLVHNKGAKVNVNPATINRVASARSLTGEQTAAIRNAIAKPVSVLTAPAGCGKSFTMSALMEVLEAEGIAYQAMAPTGRAAKVLTNMVSSVSHGSAKCTTLHVGFGIRPADDTERLVDDTERDLNDFASKGNGLNEHTKVLIIDECSMVDARMMSFVLRNARDVNIVLVGDPSQLPPVSPGRPFHDICDYGLAPITRLTKVFRQADGSPVIDAATKVREGENPVGTKGVPFYEASPGDDPLPHPVDETVGIVKELLKSGMKPVDILVCSPSRKSGSGVQNLNHALRPVMNPKYRFVGEAKRGQRGETWPQVGDRVMQITNDYEKEVMNGSTGDVVESDYEHVTVVFDEDRDRRGMAKRRVEYKPDEVHSKLSLAFATTIHKAQGSQAKACITVICMDNWFMLERSLLYTAVTRAQEKLYMVGTFDAYQKACRTDTSRHARTSLAELYAAQDALATVNA